jgi:CDP-diacylglycerol--glycerol-3-phosphate 3-phosphatidyltransferase
MTRELRTIGLLGVTVFLASSLLLGILGNPAFAMQWVLISMLTWAVVYWQSALRLHDNRPSPDAPLYPSLGWANRLTILRGFLIAASAGFLFPIVELHALIWVVAALYSVAAILDRIDGYVARSTHHTSKMGSDLDTVFDALGLVIAPLLAVQLGKIHESYLLVSVSYYAFHLGMRWRTRQGLENYPLVPNILRRTLAGFQMGYVAVVLWPPFDGTLTRLAGFAFMLPILLGFAVDWGVVSGKIDTRKQSIQRIFARLEQSSAAIWQPLLRLICVAIFIVLLTQSEWNALVQLGLTCAAISIFLGCGARIGALLMLVLFALFPPATFTIPFQIVLFSSVWIMLLGSGNYSLWRADETWIERHDGAP